jgi:uncharacterized Fe-S cluster-containing MiaB family protein
MVSKGVQRFARRGSQLLLTLCLMRIARNNLLSNLFRTQNYDPPACEHKGKGWGV